MQAHQLFRKFTLGAVGRARLGLGEVDQEATIRPR